MSVDSELERMMTARNDIRTKLVELGMATSSDKLDALASAVDGVENRGAVSATVREGDTYTIPKGYHNGSGTVSGVAGGGNYILQSKTATPTKRQQNVTPDSGYYGMSDVTIAPIPDAYQDVTSVTAAAGDVLANKVIVTAAGKVTAGTMNNNGAVSVALDTATNSYTVPAGYHNGSGTVSVSTETKSATPTKKAQTIAPSVGKVLKSVSVEAIPDAYQDVTGVTAKAAAVLAGNKFVTADGTLTDGAMANNGSMNYSFNPITQTSVTIPAGYTTGGNITLTEDLEAALAAI